MSYEVDRTSEYQGIEYRVVEVLDNDLLLVVVKADLENGKFPLQTFIVPDDYK
ncbi:hypothetical protein [Priestia megaterium]|uniref:hypothetical protein n=1 Tax=Priestia megaterium TaxID=1404 RepID=UPI0030099255